MKLCFLASLSTNSDDICFIFLLDRSCDTLQHTKPGWFLKRASQMMHLCGGKKKKITLCKWKGPTSAWIQYLQGVVPVTALNAGSRSWIQASFLEDFQGKSSKGVTWTAWGAGLCDQNHSSWEMGTGNVAQKYLEATRNSRRLALRGVHACKMGLLVWVSLLGLHNRLCVLRVPFKMIIKLSNWKYFKSTWWFCLCFSPSSFFLLLNDFKLTAPGRDVFSHLRGCAVRRGEAAHLQLEGQ